MKTLLIALALVVSACQGCGEPSNGVADAGTDAARPTKQVTIGPLRIVELGEFTGIDDAQFTDASETTALFCERSAKHPMSIGFLDLDGLRVSKEIEIEGAGGNDCHLSLVDETYLYVMVEDSGVDKPGEVIKLTYPGLVVLARWPLPQPPRQGLSAPNFDFDAETRAFQGVIPTSSPSKAVVSSKYIHDEKRIVLTMLNLETGEYAMEPILETPAVHSVTTFRSLGPDRLLVNVARQDVEESQLLAMNLDGSQMVRVTFNDPLGTMYEFDVEPSQDLLAVAGVMSAGWAIYDLKNGGKKNHFDYVNPGFFSILRWLGPDCIAHVDNGSSSAYLTFMDTKTGAYLGATTFPKGSDIRDVLVTKDRRKLYLFGSHIIEVPIEIQPTE